MDELFDEIVDGGESSEEEQPEEQPALAHSVGEEAAAAEQRDHAGNDDGVVFPSRRPNGASCVWLGFVRLEGGSVVAEGVCVCVCVCALWVWVCWRSGNCESSRRR